MYKLSKIVLPVVALLVIAGFTAFAAPAKADPFATLLFTGTISAVGVQCTAPAPFAGVVVGDPWLLTYTFDAATTDVDASPTAGQYRNAVTDMELSIGGTSVSGSPGTALPSGFSSVIAVNLITSGLADYTAQVGLPDASAWGQVALFDDTGTPFGDDSLPLNLPTPLAAEFPTLRAFFLREAGSTLVCLQGTVSSYVTPLGCSQPPAGLVSWWPGDGDAFDLVGGNHGTMLNEVTFGPGKVGEAFAFGDGVDDWVSAPGTGIDELQELTIEAWVTIDALIAWPQRFVTLDGAKAVLRHDGANQVHQLHFYMNFGGPPWEGKDDLHGIRVDDVLYADTWYHVAGSYDGSVMRLYLQGELVGSHPVSGTVFNWHGVELPHQAGEGLDGLLDEVSIYNRALSASEIQSIFEADTTGKCKALASLIDFIQGLDLRKGIEISLISSLEDAQKKLADENPNNDKTACVNLSDFIKKVDANAEKGRLTAGQADFFRQSAEALRAALGCP